MDLAAKWFEAQLRRPVGDQARAYLGRRDLPEEQWSRFGLGYAPAGRTALKDYLVAKGAKPGDLVEAGLLIAPEDGGAPYDRFRERIMFPITDARGRIVSFGGRALDPEAKAKYLNGPETSLFHKGLVLYGLPEARRLLHAGQVGGGDAPLVVVEGYMDVLACQRADIPAVAPMGTALTEEQMELLWRLHPEPTLCFDADKAGARAASRSIDRALPKLKPGRSFKVAILSGGKDPDDVLREQGPGALRAQVAETRPFVTVLFERERDLEPLDTPERRAALKARLRQAAASIEDKDLASGYRDDLLARFDALFQRTGAGAARQPFQRRARPQGRRGRWDEPEYLTAPSTPEGKAAAKSLQRALQPLAAAVAQGAIEHPAWLDDHLEPMEVHGFGDPQLSGLASEIIRLRLLGEDRDHALDTQGLVRHLADLGYGLLLGEVSKAARKSGAPFLAPDPAGFEREAQEQWSQAFEVLTRVAALEDALSTAKAEAGQGLDSASFSRLKAERDALKRAIRTGTLWHGGSS
jgi:DNA primase